MCSGNDNYNAVIIDESHYIKNIKSQRCKAISPLVQNSERALLLSGAPALNRPSELFSQIDSLLPKLVKNADFSNRYCDRKQNPWSKVFEYTGCKFGPE